MSASIKNIPGLTPPQPQQRGAVERPQSGVDFQEALKKIQGSKQTEIGSARGLNPAGELKFSSHAIDRMRSRGVRMNSADLKELEQAVQKAAEKGSKNTLVLRDDSAFIVSVKNGTVVTVMDKDMLKENVFTNIDSTVVI